MRTTLKESRRSFQSRAKATTTSGTWEDQEVHRLISGLKECSTSRDLATGKTIHAKAVDSGLYSNTFLLNTLINMYSKCGCIKEARRVFEQTPARTVVSWNSIISAYVSKGESRVALELLHRMHREGHHPNSRTYASGLMACGSLASSGEEDSKLAWLEKGMEIHSQAVSSWCNVDVFLASNLVGMYAKCGCMFEARVVFDRITFRDLVVWNVLLQGYVDNGGNEMVLKLVPFMESEGHTPDGRTFVAALMACGNLADKEPLTKVDGKFVKVRSLDRGLELLSRARRGGWSSDIFVAGAMIEMFCRCRSLSDARSVFESMGSRRDVVCWTSLVLGYAESGEPDVALQLFERMQAEGCVPDAMSFVAAMVACGNLAAKDSDKVAAVERARSLHSQAVKSRLSRQIKVENTLMDMYSKCGSLEETLKVFDQMLCKDVISWNVVIHGCVENGDPALALKMFSRMHEEGCPPNGATFVSAAMACSRLAEKSEKKVAAQEYIISQAEDIHSKAKLAGFEHQTFVASSLVEMYGKIGCMEKARTVFERMSFHDTVSWNGLIVGYTDNGYPKHALEAFKRMRLSGCSPNSWTHVSALLASGSLTSLEAGKAVHADVLRNGSERDSYVASGLVDFYGKCGAVGDAQRVFDFMRRRDPVTWSALMAGYAFIGDTEQVLRLFEEMVDTGLKPDGVVLLLVLSACNHAGLVETGRKYFEEMVVRFEVQPEVKHYHCVIDMLGRGRFIREAVRLARSMPFAVNVVTCTNLLSACWKWKDVESGKEAFELFLEAGGDHPAGYSLMANIYGSVGMWEEHNKVVNELERRRSERKKSDS